MIIELKVKGLNERVLTTNILVDDKKISTKKYYDEVDFFIYDSYIFGDVIKDIRLVCREIGREDLVKLLKFKVNETSEYYEDEWDSYYEDLAEYIFDGKTFRVITGDYDRYENTEFADLVEFLNKEILDNTDTEILLTII